MALPPGINNIQIPSESRVVCPIGMGNKLTVAALDGKPDQKVSLHRHEIIEVAR
jgi:hypothetical protein